MRTFELNNILVTEIDNATASIQFKNIPCLDSEIIITRPAEHHIMYYAKTLEKVQFYNKTTNCFDCFTVEANPDNIFQDEYTFDFMVREVKEYFQSQSKFIVAIINKVIYTNLIK